MFDQDAGLLSRMTLLGSIYEAVEHYRGLKGPEIHNVPIGVGRVLVWLESIGIQV